VQKVTDDGGRARVLKKSIVDTIKQACTVSRLVESGERSGQYSGECIPTLFQSIPILSM
jgi:hypothetical protein